MILLNLSLASGSPSSQGSGLGFCDVGPKLTCETHFLGLLGSVSDSVRGLGHAASLRVISVSMAVFIQFNVSCVALLGKTCDIDNMWSCSLDVVRRKSESRTEGNS